MPEDTTRPDDAFSSLAFQQDAAAVVGISRTMFDAIIEETNAAGGFLDPRAFQRLKSVALLAADSRDSLTNFLYRFTEFRVRDSSERSFADLVRDWSSEIQQAWIDLDPEFYRELVSRIAAIASPKPAVERHFKAMRVARISGTPLVDIKLVCDARPVFDESRENVDGIVPITTLRVVFQRDIGQFLHVQELTLTEDQVEELCDLAQQARTKLRSLKQFLSAKGISVANERGMSASSTRTEDANG